MERDPELVLRDYLDEKIDIRHAEADYGVAIDKTTKSVDWQRTASLRSAARSSGRAGAASKAKQARALLHNDMGRGR